MTGDAVGGGTEVAEVSGAVSNWIEQVGLFLGVVQAALEQSRPREDATAEVRAMVGDLPALIRQCRAQVPTPEMIHTWVKSLSTGVQSLGAGVQSLSAGVQSPGEAKGAEDPPHDGAPPNLGASPSA
jgi:hypothetical protein